MNTQFIQTIKRAALDAYENEMPSGIYFGQVISVSPLKIQVEQKMLLEEEYLILTRNVKDYTTTVSSKNEPVEKEITVHNALRPGENVILLRMQGGQRFIVLERL